MSPLAYALLQAAIFASFAMTAVRAWKISRERFLELMTAFAFGLLLEEGDILLFGTYGYSRHWLSIGLVPIGIGMTWAMIIAASMNLSDALGLPSVEASAEPSAGAQESRRHPSPIPRWALASVADAVWAILLDLAFDAVAIRLGLWTWTIPLDSGWFGVPYGNFFAWLFVAVFFSLGTRLVRKSGKTWIQLLVPLGAYAGLLAMIVLHDSIGALVFSGDPNRQWLPFLLAFAAFSLATLGALLLRRGKAREKPDPWLALVRLLIHGTFMAAMLAIGIPARAPTLLVVALVMFALELALLGTAFILPRERKRAAAERKAGTEG
ncbi:MAG: carotenoid biosynthesis protein [Spirochaetota bacterium]